MILLLLIPSKKSSTKGKLYSLQSKSKVSEIELPKLHTWRIGDFTVLLMVCSINLPQIDIEIFTISNYLFTVSKVVLSEDPLLYSDNYVVTIMYAPFYKLAVYRSCQKDWIYIDRDELNEWGFKDIIFHKNICLCHKTFEHSVSSMRNLYSIRKYLDFERKEGIEADSTKRFGFFKLILDEGNGNLLGKKEANHIDGDIINSIYFTDDYFYSNAYEPFDPRDIGIFHLKDKNFENYYQFKSSHEDLSS
ncbi:hypothetical protein GQ457_14G005350 [Hibiscus cannabinus]